MINVESYMNDGANWQAQAVLAYIRSQQFRVREATSKQLIIDPEIQVGRFENCREQGYVFRLRFGVNILKNYAVYEHRNSDELIVLESTNETLNTPSIEEMFNGRGKYDYDHGFEYGDIVSCGDYIIEDMENLIQDFIEKHPSFIKE